MNWDAAAAIAQIISALGVIASLAYLAVQIRQNTAASRGAAYQEAVTSMQAQASPVALDADVAEIMRRGLLDFSCLSDIERFRFNWIMGGTFTSLENVFYQHTHGVVSQERWERHLGNLRFYLASPGIRTWWESFPKEVFGAEFIVVVLSGMEKLDAEATKTATLQT